DQKSNDKPPCRDSKNNFDNLGLFCCGGGRFIRHSIPSLLLSLRGQCAFDHGPIVGVLAGDNSDGNTAEDFNTLSDFVTVVPSLQKRSVKAECPMKLAGMESISFDVDRVPREEPTALYLPKKPGCRKARFESSHGNSCEDRSSFVHIVIYELFERILDRDHSRLRRNVDVLGQLHISDR